MFSLFRRQPRRRGDTESVKIEPASVAPAQSDAAAQLAVVGPRSIPLKRRVNATVSYKLKRFFGDDVDLALLEHRSSAPRRSWRNILISFCSFLIFVYCFGVQIWVVVRSIQVAQSGQGAMPSPVPESTGKPMRNVERRLQPISDSLLTQLRSLLSDAYLQEEPRHFHARALRQTKAAQDIAAECLHLRGSQVAKRGELGVVFNVLYNLWVAAFILVLLSYEHKRLRFSRKVHSACVIGLIQTWIAVDYLARGVEIWLVLAASGVFITAFFNLLYGLPKTHTHRYKLLPYLLSRPHGTSVPTAGKSYAVHSRAGGFLPSASDAVRILNEGIEEEQRQLKTPEGTIRKLKILRANFSPIDLVPYQTLPQTVLNPSLLKGLSEEEKKKHGIISKELEKSVIGGIMPFHSIGEQYNPMEMLRGMMRPTAGGKDGAAGEDPTDKLIRWKMMNDLLKDAGGLDPRAQLRPTMPGVYNPAYPAGMPMQPPAAYMAPAAGAENIRMQRYLQKQQHHMMNLPANTYSIYG